MNAQWVRQRRKRPRRPLRTPYVVIYIIVVVSVFAVCIGASFLVAANQDDPDDPTPVLRSIAFGAAVFVLATLGLAGQLVSRWQRKTNAVLYRKLIRSALDTTATTANGDAITGDDDEANNDGDGDGDNNDGDDDDGDDDDDAASDEPVMPLIDPKLDRRSPVMPVATHLRFAALALFLVLLGVGVAPRGPVLVIGVALAVTLLAWLVWMVRAGRRMTTSDDYLALLGLANRHDRSGAVRGGVDPDDIEIRGERNGREVAVLQHPKGSITTIRATTQERIVTTPSHMQLLTGEPQRTWREVLVESDGLRVRVHRTHPRAARWLLHDLLLAEAVVDVAWGHGPDL